MIKKMVCFVLIVWIVRAELSETRGSKKIEMVRSMFSMQKYKSFGEREHMKICEFASEF